MIIIQYEFPLKDMHAHDNTNDGGCDRSQTRAAIRLGNVRVHEAKRAVWRMFVQINN